MTIDEAINILKQYVDYDNPDVPDFYTMEEAIKVIIEALEQEPKLRQALEMEKGAYNALVKDLQCSDCISRQAVLKAIDAKAWEFCDYLIRNGRNDEQKPVSHFADNLRECVGEDLPSVKQEPKMGRWIEHFDESGKWYECDQCHTDWGGSTNYCPNCGAKM